MANLGLTGRNINPAGMTRIRKTHARPLVECALAVAPIDNKLVRASSQLDSQFLSQAFGAFVTQTSRMNTARRVCGTPPIRDRQAVGSAMMLHSLSKNLRPTSHVNLHSRERDILHNTSRETANTCDTEPLVTWLNGNGGGTVSKRVVEDEIVDRWKRHNRKRVREIPVSKQWSPSPMIRAQLDKSVKRRCLQHYCNCFPTVHLKEGRQEFETLKDILTNTKELTLVDRKSVV